MSLFLSVEKSGTADLSIQCHSSVLVVLIRHLAAYNREAIDVDGTDTALAENRLNCELWKARIVLLAIQSLFLNRHSYSPILKETGSRIMTVMNSQNSHINIAARGLLTLTALTRLYTSVNWLATVSNPNFSFAYLESRAGS